MDPFVGIATKENIMATKKKKTINFDGMSWGERELAQIVRRKMITKSEKNQKKYSRKTKHPKNNDSWGSFFFEILCFAVSR